MDDSDETSQEWTWIAGRRHEGRHENESEPENEKRAGGSAERTSSLSFVDVVLGPEDNNWDGRRRGRGGERWGPPITNVGW